MPIASNRMSPPQIRAVRAARPEVSDISAGRSCAERLRLGRNTRRVCRDYTVIAPRWCRKRSLFVKVPYFTARSDISPQLRRCADDIEPSEVVSNVALLHVA